MKGIIFNVVEEAVVAGHGDAAWDDIVDKAGLDGTWTALGSYPDSDLGALVEAGSVVLDVPPADLTRWLGRAAIAGLARRYPRFFEPHTSTRPFLLTLNDVIHPEVRKIHADARPPEFWFDEADDRALVIHYDSARRLCLLAEGMILGAADHYGERARVEQVACMHDGADRCLLTATFEAA